MYVKQSPVANALEAVNEAINFTGKAVDVGANIMREKVKTDLYYQSAQLEADTQDFLRSLEQENDYENFQAKTDNFLEKKRNQLQAEAKNAYSAKLMDQMLMSNRMQLQNQVKNMTLKLQVNDMKTETNGTLETYQNTLTGQNGIDNSINVISSAYASGIMSAPEALSATINNATEFSYKEKYNSLAGQIDSYISKGKSFDDLMKDGAGVFEKEYQVKMLNSAYASNDPEHGVDYAIANGVGFDDISGSIDQAEINKKVKKNLETQWKKQQDEFQDRNFSAAEQRLQSRFNETTDKEVRENIKASEYRIFKNTVKTNPYFYSEPQKYQLMHLYEPDDISADKEKKLKAAKGYDEKQFKADWNVVFNGIIDGVQNGKASTEYGVRTGYEAVSYLKDFYFEYGNQAGITEDKLMLGWISENANAISELAKGYKNNGSIENEINTFGKFVKGLQPENYSTPGLIAEADERLFDALMDIDVSIPENVSALEKLLEKEISGVAVTKYTLLKQGKDGDSVFLKDHLNKDGTIKDEKSYIHDMFQGLNNNGSKVVYTDRRGQVSINPNAQKSVEIGDSVVKNWMIDAFGAKAEDIQPEWESDDKHDLTGRRVYRWGNETYTFKVTEKLGKDKIEFVNAKGGDVIAELNDVDKFRKEREKALTKEQRKQEAEERKRLQTEVTSAVKKNVENKQADEEKLTQRALMSKAQIVKAEKIPEEYLLTWDTMGVEERKIQLQAWDKEKSKSKQ